MPGILILQEGLNVVPRYIYSMGIPSYFSHIVRQHRKIIKEYEKKGMTIHNLYMDCNSLIYDAVRQTMDGHKSRDYESKLIREVCQKIECYIRLLGPTECAMIAFDGVAPVAKLEQQRGRRYKSHFQKRALEALGATQSEGWDTVAITPGTAFMAKLGAAVTGKFASPGRFGLKKIIVSASDQVGEGEHKIYQHIRDHPSDHLNSTTVVYGLDADLIMLTLNHLHIAPSMFLFRETPHFIKSLDKTLKPDATYLLDIPEFAKALAIDLNDGVEPTTKQKKGRIFDYILLCFFLGNDFLPHFPALNIRTSGIDSLMDAYRSTIGGTNENLVVGTKIIWKNLRKLLQHIAKDEEFLIREEHDRRDKMARGVEHRKMDPEEALMSVPLRDRRVESYIDPYSSGWQQRYYKRLCGFEVDDLRRKQISTNYLEGLEWTFKYYTTGCADWRWCYQYDYPPLLEDLVKYVPYFDTTLVPLTDAKAVDPLVQLGYVLPGPSLGLLPVNVRSNLLTNHKEWYNSDFEFGWAYCKYFWEAHAHMPRIDLNELERLVKI